MPPRVRSGARPHHPVTASRRHKAGRQPAKWFKVSVRLQGGPQRAARAAAWARAGRCRCRSAAVTPDARRLARRAESPGPPQTDRCESGGGSPPAAGRAAPERRGAGKGTPGPRARVAVADRWRLLRLRRGRSGSEMARQPGRLAVRGWSRRAIPPADDPGEPSRPPPDPPASVRAVKVRLTWRAGRRPAPQTGGSTADGMASSRLLAKTEVLAFIIRIATLLILDSLESPRRKSRALHHAHRAGGPQTQSEGVVPGRRHLALM